MNQIRKQAELIDRIDELTVAITRMTRICATFRDSLESQDIAIAQRLGEALMLIRVRRTKLEDELSKIGFDSIL